MWIDTDDIVHRTQKEDKQNNITEKAKKMSNTDSTQNLREHLGSPRVLVVVCFCFF